MGLAGLRARKPRGPHHRLRSGARWTAKTQGKRVGPGGTSGGTVSSVGDLYSLHIERRAEFHKYLILLPMMSLAHRLQYLGADTTTAYGVRT